MSEHRFVLNGAPVTVRVADDVPLVWVLRDVLNLTGTKYGCGRGLCRACTVHVDGRPTPSCLLPIGELKGEVTTIEGLAQRPDHPVLRAWEAEQVPQCGWCQPGQIMSATALLQAHPRPSDADIAAAMRPHLCRCGTYNRIKKAIGRAARSLPVAPEASPSSTTDDGAPAPAAAAPARRSRP